MRHLGLPQPMWRDLRQLDALFWLGCVSRADFDRALAGKGQAGGAIGREVKAYATIDSRRSSWFGDCIRWVSFAQLDRAWWDKNVAASA